MLHLEELAAGKFLALMSRAEAWNYLDAARVLDLGPEILKERASRIAFVLGSAASRENCASAR